MVNHKIVKTWEVIFDDGSKRELEIPKRVYYFNEQKYSYLVIWLENLIEKYNIKSKPVEIKEVDKIVECEPYSISIGL
jgi:hypothetical protein